MLLPLEPASDQQNVMLKDLEMAAWPSKRGQVNVNNEKDLFFWNTYPS